jgi:hypothetical protein
MPSNEFFVDLIKQYGKAWDNVGMEEKADRSRVFRGESGRGWGSPRHRSITQTC